MITYGDSNGKVGVESMGYEQGQYEAPRMEGYNPAEIENENIAYQPQGNGYNRNQYQRPTQRPTHATQQMSPQQVQQLNQQHEQMQRSMANGPTRNDAYSNLDRMTGVLDNMNAQGIGATADGSDVQAYAIRAAIDSLYSAMKVLDEVDYWLPRGKEGLKPRLEKAGAPIVNALRAYTNAIESLA